MSEEPDVPLAPLEALRDIVPQIEVAQQRARLGSALQKATANAEQWAGLPAQLEGFAALIEASGADLERLSEISEPLSNVLAMADTLAGDPSAEDLDKLNQVAFTQLSLRIQAIERTVERAWRDATKGLGAQGSLGRVLEKIPGVEPLGRDLSALARDATALTNKSIAAEARIAERYRLEAARAELGDRLLAAGIATEIADFLVSVAEGPVSLAALDEVVWAWLKTHEALAMFEVSALPA